MSEAAAEERRKEAWRGGAFGALSGAIAGIVVVIAFGSAAMSERSEHGSDTMGDAYFKNAFEHIESGSGTVEEQVAEKATEVFGGMSNDMPVFRVSRSPAAGWLELMTREGTFLLSDDYRFLIEGTLYDLENDLNLTKLRKAELDLANAIIGAQMGRRPDGDGRQEVLEQVKGRDSPPAATKSGQEARADIYRQIAPDLSYDYRAVPEKAEIAVFTDPTCPQCQRLHEHVPALVEAGLSVRYLFMPRVALRNGLDDPKALREIERIQKAVCSPDSVVDALFGGDVEAVDNVVCPLGETILPVDVHVALAQLFGIVGTPTFLTPDGELIVGFRDEAWLLNRLGLR